MEASLPERSEAGQNDAFETVHTAVEMATADNANR